MAEVRFAQPDCDPRGRFLSPVQALTLTELLAGLSPRASGPVFPSQVNGHGSGSAAHGGESLREDLQEFLGGEAPLQQLDDLTKVNPVTLETGMPPPPTPPHPRGVRLLPEGIQFRCLGPDRTWTARWAAPDPRLAAPPRLPNTGFAPDVGFILIRSVSYLLIRERLGSHSSWLIAEGTLVGGVLVCTCGCVSI